MNRFLRAVERRLLDERAATTARVDRWAIEAEVIEVIEAIIPGRPQVGAEAARRARTSERGAAVWRLLRAGLTQVEACERLGLTVRQARYAKLINARGAHT